MNVILLKDIKDLGKKNDVKEVSDGYARNFLVSRGLAKIADEKSIKELKDKKDNAENREKEIRRIFEAALEELSKREFVFNLKVGKKGEVYSSITKDEIKEKIYKNISGLEKYKDYIGINLEKSLKAIGEYLVEINFTKGISRVIKGKVRIKIVPLQQ